MALIPATLLLLEEWIGARPQPQAQTPACCCPCHLEDPALRDAKAKAEADTGGLAVCARRARLPFHWASEPLGAEVLVYLAGRDEGWRCFVDLQAMKVVRKEAILNPAAKVR
jgi:hypothetical protein